MEKERFTLRGFQRNMIIRFVSIAAAGGLISLLFFNLVTKRRLDEIFYTFHLPRSIDEFLLPYVIAANLVALLVVMFALMLTMKSVFWKVTGPLFRISQDVKKLNDGDLTVSIRLRKDDEFKDIAEGFDLAGKAMRDRFIRIKNVSSEIRDTGSAIALNHGDNRLLKEKCEALKKQIEGLREGLDAFKI